MAQYPELQDAIQVSAEVFNSRVERALAERAIGFYADNFTWRRTTHEEREAGEGPFILEPSDRKYYAPDVNAASLWLRNRAPERWAAVQKHVVQPRYQTSEEILQELQDELIEMKALPAPEEE
jgi:hypothetical protein